MTAQLYAIRQEEPKRKKTWERVSDTMELHVPSGIYYASKFKACKGRFRKTTGETRKGRAQTIADQMIAEWMTGKRKVSERPLVSEVIDELDEVLEVEGEQGERRKRTCDKDGTYLPIIKQYFGDRNIDELDEQAWEDWIRTTGRKLDRTLGDIAKYLSKVLTFAFRRKYINRKPEIRNPDQKSKEVQTYDLATIKEFLKHAGDDLRDLIIIGAECGLRPHENRELRWGWITFKKESVLLSLPEDFTKTHKAREIQVSENAAAILRRRRKSTPTGPFVFPSPSDPMRPVSDVRLSRWWSSMLKSLNRARLEAGEEPLKGVKFHWLRHSFASAALIESGMPLPQVAAYMGNSPKILFDRYLAKDASKTKEVSGVVKLDLGEE